MRETPEGVRSRIMAMIRLRIGLEEDASPDLHDSLSGFAHHAAKSGVVGVVVNSVVVGVVKDVLRFQAKLEVSCSFCSDGEFFQQRRIRVERTWISNVREDKRRVCQGEVGSLHESSSIQNPGRILFVVKERSTVWI